MVLGQGLPSQAGLRQNCIKKWTVELMDCGDIIFVLTNSASPPACQSEGAVTVAVGEGSQLGRKQKGPGVNNGGNI